MSSTLHRYIFFTLLGFAFSACLQKEKERSKSATTTAAGELLAFLNLAPETQYVGDEDCALCHSEIFKSFKQTGMGRSFYPPTAAPRIETLSVSKPVYEARSNFYYEAFVQNDTLYQREYRLNGKRERMHELTRPVEYVIGSGNHARTYLTRENGFLFELPLTWYVQKQSWGMSPGYANINYRFSRPVIAGCMSCHNSYAEHTPYSGNHYNEVPHGIGCERCHGPGELHVAKRYQNKPADSTRGVIDRTIVNPRRLPAARQMDVCYQCHLQGEMRVLKSGKRENDFRPGLRLQDVRSVYVLEASSPGDLRVASHGERLARSACYVKSAGKLVCITCHDPHRPVKTVARSFFNQTCRGCHASLSETRSHQAAADCISCHMPQGKTTDVVHVNFTEHWIQKMPNAVQVAASTLKDFFGEEDNEAEIRLGIAYLQYFDSHKEPEHFEAALTHLHNGLQREPANADGLYHLGLAYAHRAQWEEAAQQFRAAIESDEQNALAHLQLAHALSQMGKFEAAAVSYQIVLRLLPSNAAARVALGRLYLQMKKPNAALECFQRAAAAQPSFAPGHNALGEFFAYEKQNLAAAKSHFTQALRLDPDHAPALNNLGNVALAAANYAEAAQHFTRVLALDASFVPAHGNLAFIYALQRRNEEAKKHLRAALAIEPQNERLKSMLAQIEKQ